MIDDVSLKQHVIGFPKKEERKKEKIKFRVLYPNTTTPFPRDTKTVENATLLECASHHASEGKEEDHDDDEYFCFCFCWWCSSSSFTSSKKDFDSDFSRGNDDDEKCVIFFDAKEVCEYEHRDEERNRSSSSS